MGYSTLHKLPNHLIPFHQIMSEVNRQCNSTATHKFNSYLYHDQSAGSLDYYRQTYSLAKVVRAHKPHCLIKASKHVELTYRLSDLKIINGWFFRGKPQKTDIDLELNEYEASEDSDDDYNSNEKLMLQQAAKRRAKLNDEDEESEVCFFMVKLPTFLFQGNNIVKSPHITNSVIGSMRDLFDILLK